jgi:tRNA(Ile)-lysidine synthase TilS/MesJ
MDKIVSQVGKKNNCTFCGVFRRQALDRGAAQLGVDHIVTGHNADDIAETVLMNSESRAEGRWPSVSSAECRWSRRPRLKARFEVSSSRIRRVKRRKADISHER